MGISGVTVTDHQPSIFTRAHFAMTTKCKMDYFYIQKNERNLRQHPFNYIENLQNIAQMVFRSIRLIFMAIPYLATSFAHNVYADSRGENPRALLCVANIISLQDRIQHLACFASTKLQRELNSQAGQSLRYLEAIKGTNQEDFNEKLNFYMERINFLQLIINDYQEKGALRIKSCIPREDMKRLQEEVSKLKTAFRDYNPTPSPRVA